MQIQARRCQIQARRCGAQAAPPKAGVQQADGVRVEAHVGLALRLDEPPRRLRGLGVGVARRGRARPGVLARRTLDGQLAKVGGQEVHEES